MRKWVLECTTAGTTGAAVPAWPATVTQDTTTVTDGAVFTFRQPGYSSGTTADWTFATIFAVYAASAMAAGDRLFVSNNHAETTAAALNMAFPGTPASPNQVLCVVDTAAPPTALATTATISSTNSTVTITGHAYVYGVGINSYNSLSLFTGQNNNAVLKNCPLAITRTGANTVDIVVGAQSSHSSGHILLDGCNVSTQVAGVSLGTGRVTFRNTTWNADTTGIIKGIGQGARGGGNILCEGCDFSACLATVNGVVAANVYGGSLTFRNCKLPASWTGSLVNGTLTGHGFRASMYNTDSADTNYRLWIEDYAGSIKSETTIVRTGGASDGTTALSWNMTTSANAEYPLLPLRSDEIVIWNDTTAAAKTVTVEILHDSLTALNDDEVWVEVQYLGTAGFPLGSNISDAKADVLAAAAAQTASTEAWTTTGLTNPNKQKLSVTFTPQEKGYFHATVHLAKASYTVYVDPKLTVA